MENSLVRVPTRCRKRILSPVSKSTSEPVTRPRSESSTQVRLRILNAAAESFSTLSYAGTGLRQIADKVGIRAASLYHHFGSKEEILEEILRIGLNEVSRSTMAAVGSLPISASPRQRLEAAIGGHLRGIFENIRYTSTNLRFHGQMPREVELAILPIRARYTDYWRRLLEDAAREGFLVPGAKLSLLRSLLLGAMNRTAAWFDTSQGPVDELIETVLLSFNGVLSKVKR